MKLYIKYLVSLRCKIVVRASLKGMGIKKVIIDFGEVEIMETITMEQRADLASSLKKSGMLLLNDAIGKQLSYIQKTVDELVAKPMSTPNAGIADLVAEKLGDDFPKLSGLFAEVKGITLLQYINVMKIEMAKGWLLYDDLSLKEIAQRLNYGTVAKLSAQFKKTTGLSPFFYKELKNKRLSNLSKVGNV